MMLLRLSSQNASSTVYFVPETTYIACYKKLNVNLIIIHEILTFVFVTVGAAVDVLEGHLRKPVLVGKTE